MATPAIHAPQRCRAQNSILIVADIQREPGEGMPAKVLNRVILNAALLARSAHLLGIPLLHTEQQAEELGPTLAPVVEALDGRAQYFGKRSFSCCGADGFQAALDKSGRRQVIIVGMEAHVGVLQTALDLLAAGLEVYVVEDAICSRRLENYQNALDRLRQSGVVVVSAESVVFEWLEGTAHPQYAAVRTMLR